MFGLSEYGKFDPLKCAFSMPDIGKTLEDWCPGESSLFPFPLKLQVFFYTFFIWNNYMHIASDLEEVLGVNFW